MRNGILYIKVPFAVKDLFKNNIKPSKCGFDSDYKLFYVYNLKSEDIINKIFSTPLVMVPVYVYNKDADKFYEPANRKSHEFMNYCIKKSDNPFTKNMVLEMYRNYKLTVVPQKANKEMYF
jgi:hypothetical protein